MIRLLLLFAVAIPALGQALFSATDASMFSVLTPGISMPSGAIHLWDGTIGYADQIGSNNGTPTGSVSTGANGYQFGTANGYISLASTVPNGTNYTISVWARPNKTAMNLNAFGGWVISERGLSSNWDYQLYYSASLGLWTFIAYNAANSGNTDVGPSTHNVWQHLAAVVNGTAGTLELFVNGASANGPTVLTIVPNDSSVTTPAIATSSWGTRGDANVAYHGDLDKIRFWTRALTTNEVQSVYSLGRDEE